MINTYQDFCKTISDELFAIIEAKGSLLSWHKGWDDSYSVQLPMGVNGYYHGANLFHLLRVQQRLGLRTNQWMTFHQIKQQGGNIQAGAKSQKVFFWSIRKVEHIINGETLDIEKPFFKLYSVFNLEQTNLDKPNPTNPLFEENAIDAMVQRLGVTISYFGHRAYYQSVDDVIVLPKPERFQSKANFFATMLHEVVHWSAGRVERLPRPCFDAYATSQTAKAQEELIAEIGSLFLCIHFGLKAELENHASYVQSWKTLLSEKDRMSATHKAAQVFEWLIGHC